jgi:tRNA-dihydrouridine synthase A
LNYKDKIFSVAPMMDWTDRHCRFFHRQISRHALLYTEMVTANAVIFGDREKLLGFGEAEQPVILQLGGSEPKRLAEASKIGEQYGYREINLNVGCPSDRVQEGRFGACLMAEPHLVADCISTMQNAVKIPVTVKCRIGIDEQDEEQGLQDFVQTVSNAGCKTFVIHARKAWLKGLSPKENREVPPLNHDRVHRLKKSFPNLNIQLNGGLETLEQVMPHLAVLDGAMLGRAAYHDPWVLSGIDPVLGNVAPSATRRAAVESMIPYVEMQTGQGVALHRITRHMLGLYHAQPGGRMWRQVISTESCKPGADVNVLHQALNVVEQQAYRQAAAA